MVEKARRNRVGDHPRDATEREWEVFVRESQDDPMRHVGSVTAPDAETAHDQATQLFAWYAAAVWVCPASAVARFAEHDLDREATP